MSEKKFHRFSHQAMSTFFEVLIAGQDEIYSRSAAQAFFKEIDRLERLFNRFDPGSEISMINRLKPGEILPVGVETYECLKASFELMVATSGAFNINYRAIKREAGDKLEELKKIDKMKEKERQNLSEADKIKANLNLTDGRESERKNFWLKLFPLELIKTGGRYLAVRLEVPEAGLDLDLGAIGKGYSLEKAAEVFADWEINDFLVNAGQSTVYACGEKPWPVAVGSGFDFFRPGKIYLQGRALSGSGHEVKGEHIFDPWQKEQKSRHLAVWVSHPSPALADGLSTAFMVMSLEEIRAYTEKHPEVWTLVLSRDKNSYLFNAMNIYEDHI